MDERDIEDLARLHVACLTDSAIGALGVAYVRSFYRYVTRSEREIAVVQRNHAGRIVAAAVVSLEPATLTRRLLWHTSLLVSAAANVWRLPALLSPAGRSTAPASSSRTEAPSTTPEMILLFTSADERRNGLASALIEQVEHDLQQRQVSEYQVMTVADATAALAFYRAQHFTPSGTSFRLGKSFQVFTRKLDAAGGRP